MFHVRVAIPLSVLKLGHIGNVIFITMNAFVSYKVELVIRPVPPTFNMICLIT